MCLAAEKKARNAESDTDLTADDLKELVEKYKEVVKREKGFDFPAESIGSDEASHGSCFWFMERQARD